MLVHSYFEKEMKTPYTIMNNSAMGEHQKASILSNELVRRLSNIDIENVKHEEVAAVIEKFIKQLKSSGYNQKHSKEHTVNGIKGWKNKISRRKKEGKGFYRLAGKTLKKRLQKKLTEKETWYRKERVYEDLDSETDDDEEDEELKENRIKRKRKSTLDKTGKKNAKKTVVKAAMFVPYTVSSKLAKELREMEFKLEDMGGHRLKIVEKAGTKLADLITQSNPWKGQDCARPGCWLCTTKQLTGKLQKQECDKRSLVYETSCYTCEERERKKIDEEDVEEIEKEKRKREIRKYIYIGETSRSVHERGWEHISDMEQLRPCSHLLKHVLDVHEEEEDYDKIRFDIKVLNYTRSSFERQILESVLIQQKRKSNFLLNSKAEYNRCAVPRITTKIGEKHFKKWEKESEKEKAREEELEEKIRRLRKVRNRGRRRNNLREQPAGKRLKVNEAEYLEKRTQWGKPETREKGEKRSERNEERENN